MSVSDDEEALSKALKEARYYRNMATDLSEVHKKVLAKLNATQAALNETKEKLVQVEEILNIFEQELGKISKFLICLDSGMKRRVEARVLNKTARWKLDLNDLGRKTLEQIEWLNESKSTIEKLMKSAYEYYEANKQLQSNNESLQVRCDALEQDLREKNEEIRILNLDYDILESVFLETCEKSVMQINFADSWPDMDHDITELSSLGLSDA